MLKDLNLTSAILVALLAVPVLLVAFMDPIAEWLDAREKRKKSEAEAKATAGAPSTASPSSTVAPSAAPSTPEPA